MPIDDILHPFAKFFAQSFCLLCAGISYVALTTLYSMMMIGSCMCFEACIDDLIQTLRNIGSTWKNDEYPNCGLVEIIEYQIESIT